MLRTLFFFSVFFLIILRHLFFFFFAIDESSFHSCWPSIPYTCYILYELAYLCLTYVIAAVAAVVRQCSNNVSYYCYFNIK